MGNLAATGHSGTTIECTAILNTSLSTVRQWEIGQKRPGGTSLKLLNLLDRKGLEALI